MLGGLRLANAEAWVARSYPPPLSARSQAFLDASRAQEQARSAEKAEAAGRLWRLAIALAVVAAVAVVLAIAAGVFGVQSQQSAADARAQGATAVASGATAVAEKQRADAQGATAVAAGAQAQQQATLALARQLVAQAAADTDTQPDRTLLLSIEATRLTSEARPPEAICSVSCLRPTGLAACCAAIPMGYRAWRSAPTATRWPPPALIDHPAMGSQDAPGSATRSPAYRCGVGGGIQPRRSHPGLGQ